MANPAPGSAGTSTASSQILGNPGAYANGNIIDSGGAKSEFVSFNPSTLTYNLMLKAGAQAIGAGTAVGAPTVNIFGTKRVAPYTAGAYSYPLRVEAPKLSARWAERGWRGLVRGATKKQALGSFEPDEPIEQGVIELPIPGRSANPEFVLHQMVRY